MIAYLNGSIAAKCPTEVVIDVQGIGYQVLIPLSTFERLGEVGQPVKLLTHQHVREDLLQLFGFFTEGEKQMFLQLTSVSGVGPKLALAILSGSRADELIRAIAASDIQSLTRLPGVGKKTAQRLCLELKDKVVGTAAGVGLDAAAIGGETLGKMEEGVMALTSLGLSRADAERSLMKVLTDEPDLPLDELIRRCLKKS